MPICLTNKNPERETKQDPALPKPTFSLSPTFSLKPNPKLYTSIQVYNFTQSRGGRWFLVAQTETFARQDKLSIEPILAKMPLVKNTHRQKYAPSKVFLVGVTPRQSTHLSSNEKKQICEAKTCISAFCYDSGM